LITGIAHTAVCVPDVDAATAWYAEVLGMEVLSPPYTMTGPEIDRDMGQLLPRPVAVRAAIVGRGTGDRVLELLEYPNLSDPSRVPSSPDVGRLGLTHVGLLCDDVAATRSELEALGVHFVTDEVAEVAGLRTTWFADPWGVLFILIEKGDGAQPYWRQPLAG